MQNLSELTVNDLSSDGLRNRVQYYYDYAQLRKGDSSNVFISTVIPRSVLQEMLNTTDDTGGIRIYLSKDTPDDTEDNVRLLAVPVRAESSEAFTDLLHDESKVYLTDCRDPYCPKSFTPDGPSLLPHNFFS